MLIQKAAHVAYRLRLLIWLLAVFLLAEGSVRTVGFVLRRDSGFASSRAGKSVIYCLGDSFTYGQGVATEEAWPRVLGRLLKDEMSLDVPVRPLADPGRISSVVTLDLAETLKADDARLVLILTGWNANDGDFAAHIAERKQAVPWTSRIDIWLEHSRLYRVAKQALTYRSRTVVLDEVKLVPQTSKMSLYNFRDYQEVALKNLRQIARMCRAAGVPCALLTYPHQKLPPNPYTDSEYYHIVFGSTPLSEDDYLFHDRRPDEIAIDAVIRYVGETEGIPVIDLQPAFRATPQPAVLFLSDFHHPTALGHQLIARAVFDAIRPTLGQGAAATPR